VKLNTFSVQNTVARLLSEITLSTDKPSRKVKIQYHKAIAKLQEARLALDLLNDELEKEQTND